jgi:hypothetical protein
MSEKSDEVRAREAAAQVRDGRVNLTDPRQVERTREALLSDPKGLYHDDLVALEARRRNG